MLRILVAEDEATTRLVLERKLKVEAYDVHMAADGSEALRKAEELRPDIVVSDVEMPLMSGTELCRELRSKPYLQDTYVILLTSLSSTSDKLAGLRAGADDYLVKPVKGSELISRIEIAQRVLAAERDRKAAAASAEQAYEEIARMRETLRRVAEDVVAADRSLGSGEGEAARGHVATALRLLAEAGYDGSAKPGAIVD